MTPRNGFPTLTACALLAVLACGGCSGDDVSDPDPGPVLPATPEAFMLAFAQAYTDMNLPDYDALVRPQYDFKFLDPVRDTATWSRELDMTSTERMFNGEPGDLYDGVITCAGVDSIRIAEFIRLTPWETTDPDDPDFPDAERALYQIEIVFHVDAGENSLTVASGQIFYLAAEETAKSDGDRATGYRLCGQRDMRLAKANENLYWGDIKRMFLPGQE